MSFNRNVVNLLSSRKFNEQSKRKQRLIAQQASDSGGSKRSAVMAKIGTMPTPKGGRLPEGVPRNSNVKDSNDCERWN